LKAFTYLFRGHTQSFNCRTAAMHTEFYLEYLQLNVAFTGNAGCFKCHCVASVTKTFTLKGVPIIHHSTP
jgi:hypothetical protein